MAKDFHYLSFGASNNIALDRQWSFCQSMATYLQVGFNFFYFAFPDDPIEVPDGVTRIGVDQVDHFFETFEPRMKTETIVFNHAFFYSKIVQHLGSDHNAFIYHKQDVEYLVLKNLQVDREVYEEHLKRELHLMNYCDWLYTHSNRLVQYMQENHGYNEHRHSILPEFLLSKKTILSDNTKVAYVRYLFIGTITNANIKGFKKIMSNPSNRLTVVTDTKEQVRKQGFAKDPRFSILPMDAVKLTNVLPFIDYAWIQPKSDMQSWIEVERFIDDLLIHGIQLILSKTWQGTGLWGWVEEIIPLESYQNDLTKPSEDMRQQRIEKTRMVLGEVRDLAEFKWRNAELLYHQRVNKKF